MVRRRSTVRFRKGARTATRWTVGRAVRSGPRAGGVAQLVEQAAHNRCVAGSSPATATAARPPAADERPQEAPAMAKATTSGRRSPGVRGVQAPQLHHPEEPPQRPRPARRSRSSARTAACTASTRDPLSSAARGLDSCVRRQGASRLGAYRVGGRRSGSSPSPSARSNPCTSTGRPRARPATPTSSPRRRSASRFTRPLIEAFLLDPALGLDFARVVHGDQRFVLHRPIVAGDELVTTIHVEDLAGRGRQRHAHAAHARSPTRRRSRWPPPRRCWSPRDGMRPRVMPGRRRRATSCRR